MYDKAIIISLDGVTLSVIQSMAELGYMPFIGQMMRNGWVGNLESVLPPVTAAAWSSFMTGKEPAAHGILDFRQFDPTRMTDSFVNSRQLQARTVWEILSASGKKVGVLNLPGTYPPYPVNGFLVSGFDAPSRLSDVTYPPEFQEEIEQLLPDYSLSKWYLIDTHSESGLDRFLEQVELSFQQAYDLALYCLDLDWDVFMVHFQATDWMQHKLWDEVAAAADGRSSNDRVRRIRLTFQKLDQLVKGLIERVRAANVLEMILSDHGFGPYMGKVFPNYYLRGWGYLSVKHPPLTWDSFKRQVRNSDNVFLRKAFILLRDVKSKVVRSTWADGAHELSLDREMSIDWSKTRAVMATGYLSAHIYVNAQDRSPYGIVPLSQIDSLCEELIHRFSQIKSPAGDALLFPCILRGDDLHDAPIETIPDLVLVPQVGYSVARGFYPSLRKSVAMVPPDSPGVHYPQGILVVSGQKVKPSATVDARLVDVVPTLLFALGISIPSDMDGVVLSELFDTSRQPVYEQQKSDTEEASSMEHYSHSDADTQLIEDRLRGLGYLG